MSKAVLVMDMPKNGCMDCNVCRSTLFKTICGITGNGVSGNYERGGFPESCPLKSMPEKRPETVLREYIGMPKGIFKVHSEKSEGWNACIDAICGEEVGDEENLRNN